MMARFGVFLLWLLHFLPFRLLAWLGNGLGTLLYLLAAERRRVATTNLRLCFPEQSEAARALLVRQNFRAFTRSFLERGIMWWSDPERIKKLVRVAGLEYFQAAQGNPIILLTAHFVALDVGGTWLSLNSKFVDIYTNQKNRYLNELILRKRSRFGNTLFYSRQQGLRPVLKAMREGYPLCYFMDQDLSTKDAMFIPFFGVQAATLTTLPRLVETTQAKVVPSIIRVLPHYQGYEMRFYPAWENYPTGDIVADTRRVNEFIEQRVLEMPEQYFWLHKRFKTRPPGEERFY